MKYSVSSNFTRINSSGGTIQNISSQVIEVSNTNTLGSGVLIKPLESISFSGNIYVRCPAGNVAEVRIVPFNAASSSSSGSGDSGGDSTGDYNDPIDDIWNDNTGDSTGNQSYDPDWDSELDNIFNP